MIVSCIEEKPDGKKVPLLKIPERWNFLYHTMKSLIPACLGCSKTQEKVGMAALESIYETSWEKSFLKKRAVGRPIG